MSDGTEAAARARAHELLGYATDGVCETAHSFLDPGVHSRNCVRITDLIVEHERALAAEKERGRLLVIAVGLSRERAAQLADEEACASIDRNLMRVAAACWSCADEAKATAGKAGRKGDVWRVGAGPREVVLRERIARPGHVFAGWDMEDGSSFFDASFTDGTLIFVRRAAAGTGTSDVREAPRVPSKGDVWHLFPDDDLRGREVTLLEHRRFEWSVDKSGWLTTDGGEITDDQFANGTAVFVRAASPSMRERPWPTHDRVNLLTLIGVVEAVRATTCVACVLSDEKCRPCGGGKCEGPCEDHEEAVGVDEMLQAMRVPPAAAPMREPGLRRDASLTWGEKLRGNDVRQVRLDLAGGHVTLRFYEWDEDWDFSDEIHLTPGDVKALLARLSPAGDPPTSEGSK